MLWDKENIKYSFKKNKFRIKGLKNIDFDDFVSAEIVYNLINKEKKRK